MCQVQRCGTSPAFLSLCSFQTGALARAGAAADPGLVDCRRAEPAPARALAGHTAAGTENQGQCQCRQGADGGVFFYHSRRATRSLALGSIYDLPERILVFSRSTAWSLLPEKTELRNHLPRQHALMSRPQSSVTPIFPNCFLQPYTKDGRTP